MTPQSGSMLSAIMVPSSASASAWRLWLMARAGCIVIADFADDDSDEIASCSSFIELSERVSALLLDSIERTSERTVVLRARRRTSIGTSLAGQPGKDTVMH